MAPPYTAPTATPSAPYALAMNASPAIIVFARYTPCTNTPLSVAAMRVRAAISSAPTNRIKLATAPAAISGICEPKSTLLP